MYGNAGLFAHKYLEFIFKSIRLFDIDKKMLIFV